VSLILNLGHSFNGLTVNAKTQIIKNIYAHIQNGVKSKKKIILSKKIDVTISDINTDGLPKLL